MRETDMLNFHSFFSHTYGTLPVSALAERLSADGYRTAALTDINNVCAAIDFYDACQSGGVRPVIGVDFRNLGQSAACLYLGLAQNAEGFAELNSFLTTHLHSGEPFPARAPLWQHVTVVYPWNGREPADLRPNEYVGVAPWQAERIQLGDEGLLKRRGLIMAPVSFTDSEDFYLHCLLRAIDLNCLLSKLQRKDAGHRQETWMTMPALKARYAHAPYLLRNTEAVLDECRFAFDLHTKKNLTSFSHSVDEDHRMLRELAMAGLQERYGGKKTYGEALKRMEKELGVIAQKEFTGYFLSAWDVVHHAKNQGFFYAGRGSGANSLVAYALRITEVDPIEFDLYFERFLNMHRSSPPDFDLDFSWQDRDAIFSYLFKKYGAGHTAMLGSHSTMKFRAIARELGKVYGLPKGEIDEFISESEQSRYIKAMAGPVKDRIRARIAQCGARLAKFPRHLSMHSSGLVISQQPLMYHTATSLPPKGLAVTHFDMYTAEKYKLFKLDILSQRGLGHIKDAISLVQQNQGIKVDITQTQQFFRDPKLNQQMAEGRTTGCFYIESPAMRQLLRKLSCDNFRTLVAASSIIRPGVASSGMMKEFIVRHRNPSAYVPIHPKIGELLGETYGVMVYQEDVIKIAHHFAGLPLANADLLRRAMAWKFRVDNGFDKLENEFFESCRSKGYPERVIEEVWRQMCGFGGFSFCKAHSASYAVESYQSLHLKAYYPIEFWVAVINNFGGFYHTEFYVNELRNAGAVLHAPCINRSGELTSVQGIDVHLGFVHLKGLEQTTLKVLLGERERGGYLSLADFYARTACKREQMILLIRVGAFRFTGIAKAALMWEALMLTGQPLRRPALFPVVTRSFRLPAMPRSQRTDAFDEIELLNFPLCSPFQLARQLPQPEIMARDLVNNVGKTVRMVGYIVTTRIVRTAKGDYMQFITFTDQDGESFEASLFPQAFLRRQGPLSRDGLGLYAIQGKVILDMGIAELDLQTADRLEITFTDVAEKAAA